MTDATARRRRRQGVSLIELVVVVMMLGVAASVAVPMYFHTLSRGRVDAAARRLIADLALVQCTAESSSSSVTLQFSALDNRYVAIGIADRDRPSVDYSVSLGSTPYFCEIVSVDTAGDEQITFSGFGLPDSAGTIVIASGNLQRVIFVDPTTGKGAVQ